MPVTQTVELWMSELTPRRRLVSGLSDLGELAERHVFPSGRTALVEALRYLGLRRENTVAVPPFSSGCVNNAVGKVASPMPLLVDGPHPDAILIYEQWGWPIPALALTRLKEAFAGVPIILDSVDVPFPGVTEEMSLGPLAVSGTHEIRVWSFGKTLGAVGGGLLTIRAKPVDYRTPEGARDNICEFELAETGVGGASYSDIFRTYSLAPPSDILGLLKGGELSTALAAEIFSRQENAKALSKSEGAEKWRPWMFDALRAKSAPGIAPLFIGEPAHALQQKCKQWRANWNIETKVYHFNLSGDPLNPEYLPCLAVPLHSGVSPKMLKEAANFGNYSSRKRSCAVVVGGGFAGILAARMLTDKYDDVTIVEAAPKVGGLMRSIDLGGATFDYGTHVPMTIGHVDIDRMLFEGTDAADWNVIPRSLREGNYFKGKLNTDSGCLDVDFLPPSLRDKALRELVETASEKHPDPKTLEQRLLQDYGKILAEKLFSPVLERLIKCKLNEVTPDVLDTFSLRRIRMFNTETAIFLKASPGMDARIAYRSTQDGKSNVLKLYPKRQGAQLWLDGLVAVATKRGVCVRTETSVSEINIEDGNVGSVILTDGVRLECDLLVWAAPPIALLNAASAPAPSMRPNFIDMVFVHLIFDEPFNHDLEYMCCYDEGFLTYRVTFYPALRGDGGIPPYTATAEILVSPGGINKLLDDEVLVPKIVDEFKKMGIVKKSANAIDSQVMHQKFALPIPTPELERVFSDQISIARGLAGNLKLIGRNNFKHFLSAVLKDTYDQIVGGRPT